MLPFKPIHQVKSSLKSKIILAGDIGATKTNLALFDGSGELLTPIHEARYTTADFQSLIELTDVFTNDLPAPDAICFGVAGPVLDGHASLSNIDWEVNQTELSKHFGRDVHIINDLEATAYGLAVLPDSDMEIIHPVSSSINGNAAVIAPGTGLGEAGLFWNGEYFQPFATEGGHCDFAPRDLFDFELYTFLQKQFGHVSWERLVSGQGIANIYDFLRREKKRDEPAWLKDQFHQVIDPAVISAEAGKVGICTETMQLFIRFLAYECANLVLKTNATGGLFIGGGIPPKIINLFEENGFYSLFCRSGRMNELLEKVQISIILNKKSALSGAAWFAANPK